MIKQSQQIFDIKNGDCFRACMASILELPNDGRLPHINKKLWWFNWNRFLKPFGLALEWDRTRIWRNGYWVASVPSKNFAPPTHHAVVMAGDLVVFDPSTKKRYRTGRSLLGSTLVREGWYLVVVDPSKLHKLQEYKESLHAR